MSSTADPVSPAPISDHAATAPTSHPRAFWFFIWGEFAERCSFYGMKAILLLYMIERLNFNQGVASAWINYFKSACYFLPLLGGFLADRYFGKYRAIVAFSLPYILGHVILGFENIPCLVIALVLLAMGSGVTKPNISTLMGMTYDQQRPGQTHLRSDAFGMFYVAINSGAFASSFAVPLIRSAYGYRAAFLFPAAAMAIAFGLFVIGKPYYAVETLSRARPPPQQRHERRVALRRIFGLFAVIVFFWVVIEQYDSTWILFARDHVDLHILGYQFKPDQFQMLNPIFVMVLVPAAAYLWRVLARAGFDLQPMQKMLIGFGLTLLTPLLLTAAGLLAGDGGRISPWWLIAAYFLITSAEVCISVVGLELAFAVAPNSMKSFVTACWLLTMAVGDFMNGLITPHYGQAISLGSLSLQLLPPVYFGLMTLMMIPVCVAFLLVARRFNLISAKHAAAQVLAA